MNACGNMHQGGDTRFNSSCQACQKANKMPTYNAMTIDLAHANAKLEAALSENNYLKAQLEQCRGAGGELKFAEVKRESKASRACAWCGQVHVVGPGPMGCAHASLP